MDEDQKSNDGVLNHLALITDGMQTLFPDGKMICVFELNDKDFKTVQRNFRKLDSGFKKFSIDMSGVEHVFIHEEVNDRPIYQIEETPVVEEIKVPKSYWGKLLSRFKGGRSSIK